MNVVVSGTGIVLGVISRQERHAGDGGIVDAGTDGEYAEILTEVESVGAGGSGDKIRKAGISPGDEFENRGSAEDLATDGDEGGERKRESRATG